MRLTKRRARMGAIVALRLVVPLVSAGVFFAVYAVAVLTRSGQHLEDRALSAASYPLRVPPLLRLVSTPNLLVALIVVVLIAILRKRLDLALQAAIVIIVSNISTQVLKYGLLWRPDFAGVMTENTFPSGHTTAYLSVFLAAIIVAPPAIRSLLSLVATVLCSTIASQLLWFGWHRLSDIVGGVAVVTCVATLAVALIPARITGPRWVGRIVHRTSDPPTSAQPTSAERRPILDVLCTRILVFALAIALIFAVIAFAIAFFAHPTADFIMLLGTEALATATVACAMLTLTIFLRSPAIARDQSELSAADTAAA